ncbi:MAG TPA: nuclear transport factor 2 family protein [Nitrososphaera sp.]|nr:nuclear transport factor 2 family protein [Nitrososphaera sp.]
MKILIIRIACGIIALTAIGVCHPGETPALPGKKGSVSESMRRFSREIIAAYERRDTTALKSFYAKQPDALFFWERKMSYSWDEIDNTMNALLTAVAKLTLTIKEFRSGGSGNNGWFAATFHVERITPKGKKFSSDGRWTVIAERVNGRWLIVHEHTSFPLPEP